MSWLSSFVNDVTGRSAVAEGANAARDATEASVAEIRRQYDINRELNEPFRQSELAGQALANALLGANTVGKDIIGPVAAPVSGAGSSGGSAGGVANIGGPDYAAYVDHHGGVANWFASLSPQQHKYIVKQGFDANGDGRIDKAEAGTYHYSAHGAGENRFMPTIAAPVKADGTSFTPQEVSQQGVFNVSQDDAINAFESSPFYTTALEGFGRDKDSLYAIGGANGTALSGAQKIALDDRSRAWAGNAFDKYYRALKGNAPGATQTITQQGASAAGQIGNAFANLGGQLNQNYAAQGGAIGNFWNRTLNGAATAGFG